MGYFATMPIFIAMRIFRTLDQVTSYLGKTPKIRYLTVCHKKGVFNKGYGGAFVCYTLYKGECTKVFYRNSLYFQISCFMYKAVDPVDQLTVDMIKKAINIDTSDQEDEIFCARPFRNCISTSGDVGPVSSFGSISVNI